jgi:hypothetical protein
MGAEGGLHHGQHPVGGDADAVAEPVQVVHDPLDCGHHTPPGRPRPPHTFEHGLADGQVAPAVGHGGVAQGHIRDQGGQQAHRPEGGLHHGEIGVGGQVGPDQGPGGHGGQSPGGRLEALGHGQDGPVLEIHLPRFIGRLEDRVGRIGREAVARVGGDDLGQHPTPEEQRPEGTEAGHDQGEAGILPPVLAGHLAGPGRPPTVTQHDVHRVTGKHVPLDGVAQRRADVRHGPQAIRMSRGTPRASRSTLKLSSR